MLQDRQAWHQQEQPALQAACSGSLALWAVCSPRDSSGLTVCQAISVPGVHRSLRLAALLMLQPGPLVAVPPLPVSALLSSACTDTQAGPGPACLDCWRQCKHNEIAAARLHKSCWCSASINKRQRAVTHLFKTGVCQLSKSIVYNGTCIHAACVPVP